MDKEVVVHIHNGIFSSVQSLSHVRLWDTMDCNALGFPVHLQLPELAQTHVHWVSDAIQPSHPLSSFSPPANSDQSFSVSESFPMSQFFTSDGQSIGVSVSASVLPMNIQDIDWFDLLADQGTFKSLLQHHRLKASILRRSAFFIVQLSCPYMTTRKIIALTGRTFVGKVMQGHRSLAGLDGLFFGQLWQGWPWGWELRRNHGPC